MLTIKLNSTCLAEATYDTESHDMTLEFTSGRRYKYGNVPETVYRNLVTAPSPGRAYNATVRNQYVGVRV